MKQRKLSDVDGERVIFPVKSEMGNCAACDRPGSNTPWSMRTDLDYGPLVECDCKLKLHSQVCYSGHRHEVDYRAPKNKVRNRRERVRV